MSETIPPKVSEEQGKWIADWVKKALDFEVGGMHDAQGAKTVMDTLGLDAPRTVDRDVVMRQQLQATMASHVQALSLAPKARVPERDIAEQARARAAGLLGAKPFDEAATMKAVSELGRAATDAVQAATKVADGHRNMVKAASELPALPEVDEDGAQERTALEEKRRTLGEAVALDEPTPESVQTATGLMEELRDRTEKLAASVKQRLAQRVTEITQAGRDAVATLSKAKGIADSVTEGVRGASATLKQALAGEATVAGVKQAEQALAGLQKSARETELVVKQLQTSKSALEEKADRAPDATDGGKFGWVAAADTQIKDAKRLVTTALLEKLSPNTIKAATEAMEKLEPVAALVRDYLALNERRQITQSTLKSLRPDMLATEVDALKEFSNKIVTSLATFSQSARDQLDQAITAADQKAREIELEIGNFMRRKDGDQQRWKKANAELDQAFRDAEQNDADVATETGQHATVGDLFMTDAFANREAYLGSVPGHFVEIDRLTRQVRLLAATATPKMGYDPAADLATLFSDYKSIGGNKKDGNLATVCSAGEKAGGHYTYKGKTYEVKHASHGKWDSSAGNSVVAWTVNVGGKIRVIGVGFHTGDVTYHATFPTAGGARDCGPSVELVDADNP